jgi:hypothetical protein
MKTGIQYCPPIPFRYGEYYCYPEVWLSYYDKVFFVILIALLVGAIIATIQGRMK